MSIPWPSARLVPKPFTTHKPQERLAGDLRANHLGGRSIIAFVDDHRHGMAFAGTALQPQPLCIQQWQGSATGEGVMTAGQLIAVEQFSGLRMGGVNGRSF